MKVGLIVANTLGLSLLMARPILASPSCGTGWSNWNAPNGAIVTYKGNSPLKPIFANIGEVRTHTVVSHGYEGWASQETGNPDNGNELPVVIDVAGCGQPLEPIHLEQLGPGWEGVNMGGIGAFSANDYTNMWYVWPSYSAAQSDARAAADWIWWDAPYQWDDRGFWRMGINNPYLGFMPYTYGFNQLMNGIDRVAGVDWNNTKAGMICSQTPAYAMAKVWSGGNTSTWSSTATIGVHEYSHDQTVNSAIALWYAMYNACMSKTGGDGIMSQTLTSALTSILYGCSLSTICNSAAWQILNCFAFDGSMDGGYNVSGCYYTGSSLWNENQPNPNWKARSLSTDGITGRANLPNYVSRNKYQVASPWSGQPELQIQWSGTGIYGCWD